MPVKIINTTKLAREEELDKSIARKMALGLPPEDVSFTLAESARILDVDYKTLWRINQGPDAIEKTYVGGSPRHTLAAIRKHQNRKQAA